MPSDIIFFSSLILQWRLICINFLASVRIGLECRHPFSCKRLIIQHLCQIFWSPSSIISIFYFCQGIATGSLLWSGVIFCLQPFEKETKGFRVLTFFAWNSLWHFRASFCCISWWSETSKWWGVCTLHLSNFLFSLWAEILHQFSRGMDAPSKIWALMGTHYRGPIKFMSF